VAHDPIKKEILLDGIGVFHLAEGQGEMLKRLEVYLDFSPV
jgi:hypothetical protein